MMDKLNKINERMAGAAANKALRAGAEILQEEMSKRAPRDTGKLAESIETSKVKTKDGVKFIEVGPNKDTNWRSKFVEFGTSKMNAKPFMAPAVESKKSEINNAMAGVLREELRRHGE